MSVVITQKACDSRNYKNASRTKSDITYIVVHYTGDNGDTAENNGDYFANNYTGTSAHIFVDEDSVVQSVEFEDIAWHCGKDYSGGSATYWGKCTNANSIGVEICMNDKSWGVRQESIDHAVEVVKYLMDKYDIDTAHVIRHYDVCHKECPAPMVINTALWTAFKAALEDDEVVEQAKMRIGNELVTVDRILKDGTNYVQIRDFAEAGCNVSYDTGTKLVTILPKDTRITPDTIDSATQTAMDKLKASAGISDATVAFMRTYSYGDELIKKLAAAITA